MKNSLQKSLLALFLGLLFCTQLPAQGFNDLGDKFDDGDFKLFLRGTRVKPGQDSVYGGVTLNIGLATNNSEQWRGRCRYENPTLGDLLFMVSRMVRGKSVRTLSGLEHAYGSGFLGWFQYYNNVVATPRLLISPGFTASDYIFALEQFVDGEGIKMYDPAGYFFAAGPALMVSTAPGAGFWLDAYANYDISFGNTNYSRHNFEKIQGYPRPHFLTIGTDLHHRSGIFGGYRINTVIDRGSMGAKANRMDFTLGYLF